MKNTCIVCEEVFNSKRPSKYCSGKCRNQKWKVTNREQYLRLGAKYRDRSRIKKEPIVLDNKICQFCSIGFIPHKTHPFQICCSAKCGRKLYQSTHKDKVAEWKRKERETHKERYAKTNAFYKDQKRFSGNRLRCLKRDDYKCVDCSSINLLIVHHKDFSGQTDKPNNKIDNLETLCRSCHIKKHTHVVTRI